MFQKPCDLGGRGRTFGPAQNPKRFQTLSTSCCGVSGVSGCAVNQRSVRKHRDTKTFIYKKMLQQVLSAPPVSYGLSESACGDGGRRRRRRRPGLHRLSREYRKRKEARAVRVLSRQFPGERRIIRPLPLSAIKREFWSWSWSSK